MVAKNVRDPPTLPRTATLKNVQVNERVYNLVYMIWYRVLFINIADNVLQLIANGTSGTLANVQKHVEAAKELTQEIGKCKQLMVAKNVLDLQSSPKNATLRNAQVNKRVYRNAIMV